MADEKPATTASSPPPEKTADEESHATTRGGPGKGWMYKSVGLGFIKIPYYASPMSQLVLVSFVCFLCPGMFNAVTGLGGAGQLETRDVSKANTALYSTFAVVGFFAGSVANRIGLRLTLFIGGFGYFLYVASILSYNHNQNVGFLVFAGALLGVCAGCLWTAQGAVMMSYPTEQEKGKFISIFWIIFNMGAVIGSLVPLLQNLNSQANAVGNGTYIAFMVLMFCGFILAFGLIESKHVRRLDGSYVITMKNPSWKSELKGLYQVLRSDYYILLLFPMFIASNWFYTYQFNGVNAAKFNIRTRGLNGVVYYICQMVGALFYGWILDFRKIRRSIRSQYGLALLLALTMGIWGGGYVFQKGYTRADITPDSPRMDFKDSGYIGPMFLYMFYGFYDACFQTYVYWLMGSLTNNGRKLANFAGFYKGIQSAGAAVTWAVDEAGQDYVTQFAVSWGLLTGSILIAIPIVIWKVKDSIDIEEDLKFSDETLEDVAPTAVLENRAGDTVKA
ncbi:hypothetical protein AJ80_04375 [Polytolypa hystricis UAMH7299]|uniref:DUF895 domain membrane protein n=1 Tax=Polytolypa hystricis (strain UAMH7299) TaxID=1447883 RepID=A0A2B7YCX7_POLH7|nr:hypothetical protein AJ80_04375 [Polytolypa hystricis UAMH7299]